MQAALSTTLPRAVSVVLDLEGADSRDRVDPGFERRISTFALALVDVLLLNIWCGKWGWLDWQGFTRVGRLQVVFMLR